MYRIVSYIPCTGHRTASILFAEGFLVVVLVVVVVVMVGYLTVGVEKCI